jgi:hypothetical protein
MGSFGGVYGFEGLEEAESLLEVEVGAAYVGSALWRILAADHVGVAAIEETQAVEGLSLFQGSVEYFELLEGLMQVALGCFPVVLFQVHAATRAQGNSMKFA